MKRILITILAVIMLMSGIAVGTMAVEPDAETFLGDVNLDGMWNLRDCTLVLKYIAKWDLSNEQFYLPNADANEDGRVNLSDVVTMLKYLAW